MALSGVKALPRLSGTLLTAGPWQALFARAGYRIYPFQLGTMVRTDVIAPLTAGIQVHGFGDFAQNDYFMVARPVYYGQAPLYLPDNSRIGKLSSFGATVGEATVPTSATDDTIWPATSAPGYATAGEWIVNLGADGSATPYSAPALDGSRVSLYSDPVGNEPNAYPYLVTGQNGSFNGWVLSGTRLVDLLVTDEAGNPLILIPQFQLGEEIVQ